jgi:hypothetical protein
LKLATCEIMVSNQDLQLKEREEKGKKREKERSISHK